MKWLEFYSIFIALLFISSAISTEDVINFLPAALIASQSCVDAKEACEKDTDCYHRLFYARTSCDGLCKSQCKKAILKLYETKLGRTLLHSDFSCLGIFANSAVDCQLDPRNSILHCELAKLMCQLDEICVYRFDGSEIDCPKTDSCPRGCSKALAFLFDHAIGAKAINCTCWVQEDDSSCHRLKEDVFGKCKNDAMNLLVANQPESILLTTAKSMANDSLEGNVLDFRNSNVAYTKNKSKELLESRPKKGSASVLRTDQWRLEIIFLLLEYVLSIRVYLACNE